MSELYKGLTIEDRKKAETKACLAISRHHVPNRLGSYLIRVDITRVKEIVEQYIATVIPENSLYIGYVVYAKEAGADWNILKAYKADGKYHYNGKEINADALLRILTFGDETLDSCTQEAGITEEGLEAVIADLK